MHSDTADPSGHAQPRVFLPSDDAGLHVQTSVSMLFYDSSGQLSSTFRIFNGDEELLDSHRRGKRSYRGQGGARHSDIHQEAAERWRIQAGEGSRDPGCAVSPLRPQRDERRTQQSSGTSASWIISIRAAGGSCVCSRWLWGSEAELASSAAPLDPECCWAECTPPCTSYRTQLQTEKRRIDHHPVYIKQRVPVSVLHTFTSASTDLLINLLINHKEISAGARLQLPSIAENNMCRQETD